MIKYLCLLGCHHLFQYNICRNLNMTQSKVMLLVVMNQLYQIQQYSIFRITKVNVYKKFLDKMD